MCNNYNVDAEVTSILDEIDVYIMPTMNPDGHEVLFIYFIYLEKNKLLKF